MTKELLRHSDFGLHSDFWFRHSGFPSGKKRERRMIGAPATQTQSSWQSYGLPGLSTSFFSVLVTEPSGFSVVLVSFFTTVPSSFTSVLLVCSTVSQPTRTGPPARPSSTRAQIIMRFIQG